MSSFTGDNEKNKNKKREKLLKKNSDLASYDRPD